MTSSLIKGLGINLIADLVKLTCMIVNPASAQLCDCSCKTESFFRYLTYNSSRLISW